MGQQSHFDRVRGLVSGQSGVPVSEITLETRLFEDLGMDGDDGHEFLEAFADEFGVEMSRMAPFNYFDDEPPLSWSSSLIPVVASFSRRFRTYVRHVSRGRRAITVRGLVASARAGRWITPKAARGDADLTRYSWWSRTILTASLGFPLILGFWGYHYDSDSFAQAAGGTLLVLLLLWALLIAKFLAALPWLRRLDAAATHEEQSLSAED
jgi:acyl carrier protein